MSLDSNNPIFADLNSVQTSLSKNNQGLIPILIKLFGEFREHVVSDLKANFEASVADIKSECLAACQVKDAKITHLETFCQNLQDKVLSLEDKMDAAEAHGRKDSVIISGAVPPLTQGETTKQVAVDLIKSKFPAVDIRPNDVSISHRLQPKRSNAHVMKPPNIYVKLCRRDLKQELIRASKNQPKESTDKIFLNESLTKQRSAVLQTLLKIKKNHNVLKGVTSMDGDVYAYTPAEPAPASRDANRPRDKKHMVNTRRDLQKFCATYIRKPLEDFIDAWPGM